MTLDELRADKRDAILAIAARHGVTSTRGEAGEQSDLDLLIEAGPSRTPFFQGDSWWTWNESSDVVWTS